MSVTRIIKTTAGRLELSDCGVLLAGRCLVGIAGLTMQASRSVGQDRGLARWMTHLELRDADGRRLRLSALATEREVTGLPDLEQWGWRCSARALANVRAWARAHEAHARRCVASALQADGDRAVALAFVDGLAAWELDGRWGYVDLLGRWVIEPRFDEARPFSCGAATVRVGALWGYLDRRGRWHHRPAFSDAGPYWQGVARVVRDGVPGALVGAGWVEGAASTADPATIERTGVLLLAIGCVVALVSLVGACTHRGDLAGGLLVAGCGPCTLLACGLAWRAQRRRAHGLRHGSPARLRRVVR